MKIIAFVSYSWLDKFETSKSEMVFGYWRSLNAKKCQVKEERSICISLTLILQIKKTAFCCDILGHNNILLEKNVFRILYDNNKFKF